MKLFSAIILTQALFFGQVAHFEFMPQARATELMLMQKPKIDGTKNQNKTKTESELKPSFCLRILAPFIWCCSCAFSEK